MTTYKELQAQVRTMRESGIPTPKLNVKRTVLEAFLADPTSYSPNPNNPPKASAKKAPFDWRGTATDRKDAVKTLKALRDLGHTTPKLNATNVVLLAALEAFADTANDAPTPEPEAPTTEAPTVVAPKRLAPKAPTTPTRPTTTHTMHPDRTDVYQPHHLTMSTEPVIETVTERPTAPATRTMEFRLDQSTGIQYHRTITTLADGTTIKGRWY